MEDLPYSKSCFVCGSNNVAGLKMRFRTDGELVEGIFKPGPEHIGFIQVVHGGLLATVLDEVMVWACSVRVKKFCYCAEMSVRFLSPARPGEALTATARLVEDRKRIFVAEGEIKRANGEKVAASTGKYMPIRGVDLTPFHQDMQGTPEQLRRFIMHQVAAA